MSESKTYPDPCVCGGTRENPNPDCERCDFQTELTRLQAEKEEAERERDEAIGHNHFCPECKLYCKECQCVEAKLFESARLLTAATARAEAAEATMRHLETLYFQQSLEAHTACERDAYERVSERLGDELTAIAIRKNAPAAEVRDGN